MKKRMRRKTGFRSQTLHKRREPHAVHYLSQYVTFWIAVLSLLAFVTGNMMGQHGWTVFWKSVLGQTDDSLIVYTGTVPPIARIPDYQLWAKTGGDLHRSAYTEVPTSVLIPLPVYDESAQRAGGNLVYSMGYMGSYATGAEGDGNHPAVDIRIPVGTPVQSIMNGVVSRVGNDSGGFGTFVVIRHPNVPDPADPRKTTTLFSAYAHLSDAQVTEGQVVRKGQVIALSGQSGLASGPHLHFQIDRDVGLDGQKVPYHPYWPFTSAEASAAGLSFNQANATGLNQSQAYLATVNPMLYVQSDFVPIAVVLSPEQTKPQSLAEFVEQRRSERLARNERVAAAVPVASAPVQVSNPLSTVVVADTEPVAVPTVTPPTAASSSSAPVVSAGSTVARITFDMPHTFTGRKWETVKITLLDGDGNRVTKPQLSSDLYMRTAYGKAEFRPAQLKAADFIDGVAEVKVLPLTHTTLVIQIQPQNVLSEPMRYVEE